MAFLNDELKKVSFQCCMYTKIDPNEDDPEIIESWLTLLADLKPYAEAVNKLLRCTFTYSGENSCFRAEFSRENIMALRASWMEKVSEIAPDSMNIGYFSNVLDELLPMLLPVSDSSSSEKKKNNKKKNNNGDCTQRQDTPFEGDAFVVDVDWEDTGGGAQAFVYMRDVKDSSQRILVTAELDDYFYIQVDAPGHPTQAEVMQALSNTAWWLKNSKYKGSYVNSYRNVNVGGGPQNKPRRGGSLLVSTTRTFITSTQYVRDRRSMYGFQRHCGNFLQINVLSPTIAKDLFRSLSKKNPQWCFFEVNLDPVCKFMVRYGMHTGSCVHVKGTLLAKNMLSTCQRLVINGKFSKAQTPAEDIPFFASRNMFYDIECLSMEINTFPTPDKCPVIQISFVITDGDSRVVVEGVLCVGETETGSTSYDGLMRSFENETDMLIGFSKLIREYAPENLVGYNSNSFDMPYILKRMDVLSIGFAKEFSRRNGLFVEYKSSERSSNQSGSTIVNEYISPGLVFFDQLDVLKKDVTVHLRNLQLKTVCEHFLGNQNKEDLAYRDIPVLFQTPQGRGKIATYCLQDSRLLLELDKVASFSVKTVGMASVLGTTSTIILMRGLVFKLLCRVKKYTLKRGYLIPSYTEAQRPKFEGSYPGAFVVEPVRGLHEDPVVVCDAASLYPSCMRCDNLCWTTYLLPEDHARELAKSKDDFNDFEGHYFVKKSVRLGILVELQTDLAKARKDAKRTRDTYESGSSGWLVYESVQLATKVVMNSLYGMAGAKTSPVPLRELALTITARGRFMLNMFKTYVEENYVNITGEDQGVEIVYGDSVHGRTPIIVRLSDGSVRVVLIEHLHRYIETPYEPGHRGKEVVPVLDDSVQVWSDAGWTTVHQIVRHKYHKSLVRVSTSSGSSVVCTQDHSLLEKGSCRELRPSDVKIGKTSLCHADYTIRGYDDGSYSPMVPSVPAPIFFDAFVAPCSLSDRDACTLGIIMVRAEWLAKVNEYCVRIDGIPSEKVRALCEFLNFRCCSSSQRNEWYISYSQKHGRVLCRGFLMGIASSSQTMLQNWDEFLRDAYTNERHVHPYFLSSPRLFAKRAVLKYALKYYDGLGEVAESEKVFQGIHCALSGQGFRSALMCRRDGAHVVSSCYPVPVSDEGVYVYDLTTSNHHFQAGLGSMVVHNTDSIFFKLRGVDITKAIGYGQLISSKFSQDKLVDMKPHDFEYEKAFVRLILFKKKHYLGFCFENDPTKGKLKAMGIKMVRRDAAVLCVKAMKGFSDAFIVNNDKALAESRIREIMSNMYAGKLPIEDFGIARKITRTEYKVVPPHVKCWKRMVARYGEMDAPALGERIEFVITKKPYEKDLSACMLDLRSAKELPGVAIDYERYRKTYIDNPLREFMVFVLGEEKTNEILNASNYEQVSCVVANKRNLLGFFGVQSITTKKRKK